MSVTSWLGERGGHTLFQPSCRAYTVIKSYRHMATWPLSSCMSANVRAFFTIFDIHSQGYDEAVLVETGLVGTRNQPCSGYI